MHYSRMCVQWQNARTMAKSNPWTLSDYAVSAVTNLTMVKEKGTDWVN